MNEAGVFGSAGWTAQQRVWFEAKCQSERKDEAAGVLLAFFLGTFGAHQFYLRRNGIGALYLLFFWTGIPTILGLIECFLMPGRVRRYNWQVANAAAELSAYAAPGAALPALEAPRCAQCASPLMPEARFCGVCGTRVGWLQAAQVTYS